MRDLRTNNTNYLKSQDMRREEGKIAPNIYIIIRIYRIGQGDFTGVNVYLDPETKRQEGQLEFRTQTWSVTPKWDSFQWERSNKTTSAAEGSNKVSPIVID